MITYFFREPLALKNAKGASPQVVGEALAEIEKDGELTPKAVVQAASVPSNPLHRFLEWDDAKAANAYRIDQARSIIRSIRTEDSEGRDVPGYYSVQSPKGQSYRSHETVMASQELRLAVRRQAARDLAAWEKRYDEFTESLKLVGEARVILEDEESRPSA